MSRLFFYKKFQILSFLFFVSTISVIAQESNIYNEMLKESLKMDFMKMVRPLETDSNFYTEQIFNDIDKDILYRMLFLYRIEFLLPKENFFHFKEKTHQISPYATMFYYTNPKNEPWDKGKFNGDGSFSGEFALKGSALSSKAACITVDVWGLLLLLTSRTDMISINDLNVKKESKKDKMLRTIKKDVYHIDE